MMATGKENCIGVGFGLYWSEVVSLSGGFPGAKLSARMPV